MTKREGPTRDGWVVIPLGLVLTAVVYVLSVAPVAAAAEFLHVPRDLMRRVYAPVVWLHDHTPLRRPLEWYMELWGLH